MKRIAAIVATTSAVLMLSGCGGSEWVKPDATKADYHSDLAQCQVMEKEASNGDTLDNCMQGKGWVQE